MDKDNQQYISQNADTFSLGSGLSIYTKADTKKVVEVTNNRAHYFANLAKKFRDEAKLHCENAKHYAEENSNVTYDQLIDLRNVLEAKINTKQDSGNYALQQDIPVNLSELENDSDYITANEAENIVNIAVPDQEGNSGKFLHTDGNTTSWVKIPVETMFSIKTFDHILNLEESKGYALQGTWVYKTAAPERHGYPDFYEKCLAKKAEAGEGIELTINDLTAIVYSHPDGHQFYDIQDKVVFDAWSETNNGIWAYGIDEENERILLPKRKIYYTNSEADSNASKPDNSWYQYIVVGNTEDTQALISVSPIPTAENDTIPLFTGMYFDFKPNNSCWLRAGEQVNSGELYTSAYNTLVNCLNGINPYELNVIAEEEMLEGTDYSKYWKVNQGTLSFRTPTQTGVRVLVEKKIATDSDKTWYNLYSDGWCEQGGRCFTNRESIQFPKQFASESGISISLGRIATPPSTTSSSCYEVTTSSFKLQAAYGSNVNSTTTDVYWEANGYLAADEIQSNSNLYFKIANAVQNIELLNAGVVLENLANKVDKDSVVLDGKWIFKQILLTNSTTAVQTLDLSEYLPNDNYDYEVMFTSDSYSDASSDICKWIYTDLMPHDVNWYDSWNNTNTRHTANSFTYPVGAGRKVYVGGSTPKTYFLFAKGYRRLGINS